MSAADEQPTSNSEELCRFFGTNPMFFVDDTINSSEDYVGDGLDVLEKSLVREAAEGSEERKKQIAQVSSYFYSVTLRNMKI